MVARGKTVMALAALAAASVLSGCGTEDAADTQPAPAKAPAPSVTT